MTSATPRDTPGLIAYRVEVKLSDRWYFWGYSPTSTPVTRYELREDEVRSEPVWATPTVARAIWLK